MLRAALSVQVWKVARCRSTTGGALSEAMADVGVVSGKGAGCSAIREFNGELHPKLKDKLTSGSIPVRRRSKSVQG